MNALVVIRRFIYASAAGILLAGLVNELSFHFLKNETARGPETIELVIPSGTAEKLRAGGVPPSIPQGMVVVRGDTLVVRNLDAENHQLGPLFIPAGSSATMRFDTADRYSYSCSFASDEYLGIDVQMPVTAMTRLSGAVLAGLPLGVLIALYGLVARPPTPRPRPE